MSFKLLNWLFRRKYCECGNPKSCKTSKNKFLVLYDVIDTGPFTAKFRFNVERANKCTEYNKGIKKIYNE